MIELLYIEDDEIDVLALKRHLKGVSNLNLTVCQSLAEVKMVDLSLFNCIISDANLGDANYETLKQILAVHNVQFISGNQIEGEDIWVKPISKDNVERFISQSQIVNLKYIKELAEGDIDYEKDMIETTIRILPERLLAIKKSKNNINQLKKAAHKTKSSYRVCGIDNALLQKIEDLTDANDISEVSYLIAAVETEINTAVEELKAFHI